MKKLNLLIILILVSGIIEVKSQEVRKKVLFNVKTDIVSSYIWRGVVSDLSPNLQPALSMEYGQFSAGCWASGNFNGTYREVDLNITYNIKNFSLTVNDYCWSPLIDTIKYFEYDNKKTGHILEGLITYKGKKLPLTIMLGTMFYGADKKFDKTDPVTLEDKYINQYSTYFEIQYTFNKKDNPVDIFIGLTPEEGYYGNTFGVINAGLSVNRNIKISNDFTLPLKGSLIFNPQAGKAYFTIMASL